MSHTTLHTAYFFRGDIIPCTVEVSVLPGIGIHVVGIPDAAVKEMLLRVITAIEVAGFTFPGKKVVIEIEPHGGREMWAGAFRPKNCSEAFDLAVALGILIASEKLPRPKFYDDIDNILFFAKLGIDGKLLAPYTGICPNCAASVLSYQLRSNWNKIVGYPADDNCRTIYSSKESLVVLTDAIKEGKF